MGRGVLVPEASGGGVPSKAPNSKEEMVGAGAPWEHRQRALPAWVIGTRGPHEAENVKPHSCLQRQAGA